MNYHNVMAQMRLDYPNMYPTPLNHFEVKLPRRPEYTDFLRKRTETTPINLLGNEPFVDLKKLGDW